MQDPQLIHKLYRAQNDLVITKPIHPVSPIPVVAVGNITPRPPKVSKVANPPPPHKPWWQKLLELFS